MLYTSASEMLIYIGSVLAMSYISLIVRSVLR